jgi:hypothetical protein
MVGHNCRLRILCLEIPKQIIHFHALLLKGHQVNNFLKACSISAFVHAQMVVKFLKIVPKEVSEFLFRLFFAVIGRFSLL